MDQIVFLQLYGFVVIGIAISIMLPILRKSLPRPPVTTTGLPRFLPRFWKIAKPYFVLALFSLVVGLLTVAVVGDAIKDWKAALLIGYAWDSTLQKIGQGTN